MAAVSPKRTVRVLAHAKANLFLRIGPRRADGYHDLLSVFQALALADQLDFEAEPGRSGLNLRCTHPAMPDGPENLITRAYTLLCERFGARIRLPGVICKVDKQIPFGAGLAGGSTDAAATLLALNHLWDLGLDTPQLRALGAELGSDLPFCFLGGTAFVTGRGEQLVQLPTPADCHLVIVTPRFEVPSRAAYGWWDAAHPAPEPLPDAEAARQLWAGALVDGSFAQYLHNDFEPVVADRYPALWTIREQLQCRGAHALLTGSGSAILGLARDFEAAWRIAQSYYPLDGEQVQVTQAIGGPAVEIV